MTLKFSNFLFIFVNCFVKKIKRNCMNGLLCIAHLLEVGRKNKFLNLIDFNPHQTEVKLSHNKS